jgi:hypothetical protein
MDKWEKRRLFEEQQKKKPKLKKAKSTEISKSVSGGKDVKRKESSNKQK